MTEDRVIGMSLWCICKVAYIVVNARVFLISHDFSRVNIHMFMSCVPSYVKHTSFDVRKTQVILHI